MFTILNKLTIRFQISNDLDILLSKMNEILLNLTRGQIWQFEVRS